MSNIRKNEIQLEAEKAHLALNKKSMICLSVGLGKSKLAINRIEAVRKLNKNAKILFTGAREIYYENFKEELKKWSCQIDNIDMICNKSIHNYIKHYDLIIYDECHKETDILYNNLQLLIKINPEVEILGLTGTPPYKTNPIFEMLPVSYTYLIEDAVDEKILNDFEIIILKTTMTKTNLSLYNYYYKSYISENTSAKFSPALSRLKMFLNNIDEKVEVLNKILNKYKNEKTLVYAGSIKQSKLINYPAIHSELNKSERKMLYDNFYHCKTGILVNVGMLKESVSIPNLKLSVVLGIDSSSSSKEQILGRVERLDVNETAKLIFIVLKDTVEEKWVLNGFEKFKNKIKVYEL